MKEKKELKRSINFGNKCYYHPAREALANCERCGRLICAGCKTIYFSRKFCHRCKDSKARNDRISDLILYAISIIALISYYVVIVADPSIIRFITFP